MTQAYINIVIESEDLTKEQLKIVWENLTEKINFVVTAQKAITQVSGKLDPVTGFLSYQIKAVAEKPKGS